MTNNEKIKQILDNAPKNSFTFGKGNKYFDKYGNLLTSDGTWSILDSEPEIPRSLDDLREILELRERIVELEQEIESIKDSNVHKFLDAKMVHKESRWMIRNNLEQQANGVERYAKEHETGLGGAWAIAYAEKLREKAEKLK